MRSITTLSALAIAAIVSQTSSSQALDRRCMLLPPPCVPHAPAPAHRGGFDGGAAAAGFMLGAVGGALASRGAAYAEDEEDCYFVRKRIVDRHGNVRIRRVQVCE